MVSSRQSNDELVEMYYKRIAPLGHKVECLWISEGADADKSDLKGLIFLTVDGVTEEQGLLVSPSTTIDDIKNFVSEQLGCITPDRQQLTFWRVEQIGFVVCKPKTGQWQDNDTVLHISSCCSCEALKPGFIFDCHVAMLTKQRRITKKKPAGI